MNWLNWVQVICSALTCLLWGGMAVSAYVEWRRVDRGRQKDER